MEQVAQTFYKYIFCECVKFEYIDRNSLVPQAMSSV